MFLKLLVFKLIAIYSLCSAYYDKRKIIAIQKLYQKGGHFEGDIRFPGMRSGTTSNYIRWMGPILYVISNQFSESERAQIKSAMKEFEQKAQLRFEPLGNYDPEKYSYINFTAEPTGCWANLGRRNYRNDLNLQRDLEDGVNCLEKGVILHELMHAIGFYHQSSSYDRHIFIDILWHNVNPYDYYEFTTQDQQISWDYCVPYDYLSVTHYSPYAFSFNGEITIRTKNTEMQQLIGVQDSLSAGDSLRIKRMYGNN